MNTKPFVLSVALNGCKTLGHGSHQCYKLNKKFITINGIPVYKLVYCPSLPDKIVGTLGTSNIDIKFHPLEFHLANDDPHKKLHIWDELGKIVCLNHGDIHGLDILMLDEEA